MDDLQACRICLVMDVQMYNLRSSPLDGYFECLFGVNPHNHELLTQVCAECAVLINKCYMFREKCIRGINVLQNLLRDNVQITKKEIEAVDREHFQLSSPLSLGLPQNSYLYLCSLEEPLSLDRDNYIKVETLDTDYQSSCSDDNKSFVKIELDEINGKAHTKHSQEVSAFEHRNPRRNRGKKSIKAQKIEKKNNTKSVEEASTESEGVKIQKRRKVLKKELYEHYDVFIRPMKEQKASIKARENTESYQNANYKCTICFKYFFHQNPYEFHMKKHDPSSGPLECEVCGLRFRKRQTFIKHRSSHTYKFVCKLCPRIMYRRASAMLHKEWHTGKTYKCEHCGEELSHPTSYLTHLRSKHPSQHICNLCGHSFINDKGLRQHRTTMHKDDQDIEVAGPRCDKCDLQFLNQQAFDRHILSASNHVNEVPKNTFSECRDCGLLFSDKEKIKLHRKTHLKKMYKKEIRVSKWPKKCDYCDEMIPGGKENYFHHRRYHPELEYVHTAGKVFICEVCGYKCTSKEQLSAHAIEKHAPTRALPCAHCPKVFSTLYKYKQHQRYHTLDKPHACSACPWTFKTKGNLMRHEQTHVKDRPYSCSMCHKAFKCTSTRNSHMKHVCRVRVPSRTRRVVKREQPGEYQQPTPDQLC